MDWQHITTTGLMLWIGQWWWPFVRIAAVFWVAPMFSDLAAAIRVRILLAFCIGLLASHLIRDTPIMDPFALHTWVLTLEQILFGLGFGLCLQMLFLVLSMAGAIISQQMGLSMGMITDPLHGQSDPIISEILYALCVILFFSLNGHLVMLDVLVESLRQWPPGASLYDVHLELVWQLFGWAISAALLVSMPAIAAMLLVNVGFGVMSRAAPAFNIYSLGFPLSMITGLLAFWLSLSAIPGRYMDLCWTVLQALRGFGGHAA
jgi:flagellar biosynthetic protein FliR